MNLKNAYALFFKNEIAFFLLYIDSSGHFA